MAKQLDVLFVHPGAANIIYQELSGKFTAIEPPNWCLLLAQSCRSKGFGVAILDCDAERLTYDDSVSRIREYNPRLVVFVSYGSNPNASTTKMTGIIAVAEKLKQQYPEYRVGVVGNHVSALPMEVLSYSWADIVFTNEGVYALHNLLKTDLVSDLQNIRGIGWKDADGKPTLNPTQHVVPQKLMDVDLPGSAWDLLPYKNKPFDLYRSCNWHANYDEERRSPYASILSSLGCQFKCSFCLEAGTPINLANGSIKKIEDVVVDDVLVGWNEKSHNKETTTVEITSRRQVGILYDVTLANGKTISATPEHQFYANGQWTETRNLLIGDGLFTTFFESAITNIQVRQGTFDVYDFRCSPHHNFFANSILSHNCMINIVNRDNNDLNASASDFNVMRFWSPEFVIKEYDKLVEMGVRTIRVVDEMFLFNRKYYEPLVKLLSERDYAKELLQWIYARVDCTNPKNLKHLKDAGIHWIALGVESVDQKVRQEITKGSYKEVNIRQVIQDIRDAGLSTIANYIFGLPDDTHETMQNTLDTAIELNTETVNMYPCFALPGSPLYHEAQKNGWELPKTFDAWSFHSYECLPLPTKHLSAAEVLRFRDDAWMKYFTNPSYLQLVETKFGKNQADHVREMTKIKLKRRLLGD